MNALKLKAEFEMQVTKDDLDDILWRSHRRQYSGLIATIHLLGHAKKHRCPLRYWNFHKINASVDFLRISY